MDARWLSSERRHLHLGSIIQCFAAAAAAAAMQLRDADFFRTFPRLQVLPLQPSPVNGEIFLIDSRATKRINYLRGRRCRRRRRLASISRGGNLIQTGGG